MDVHDLRTRWDKTTENLKSGWEKLIAKLYPTPADPQSLDIDPVATRPAVDAQSSARNA